MKDLQEIANLLQTQRKALGLEQSDMYMRIGMKQQQYQRIETGSDMKLSTLLRVLEGLDLELSITPKGKALSSPSSVAYDLADDTEDLDFWFVAERNK